MPEAFDTLHGITNVIGEEKVGRKPKQPATMRDTEGNIAVDRMEGPSFEQAAIALKMKPAEDNSIAEFSKFAAIIFQPFSQFRFGYVTGGNTGINGIFLFFGRIHYISAPPQKHFTQSCPNALVAIYKRMVFYQISPHSLRAPRRMNLGWVSVFRLCEPCLFAAWQCPRAIARHGERNGLY
jgi:hypothetical protein